MTKKPKTFDEVLEQKPEKVTEKTIYHHLDKACDQAPISMSIVRIENTIVSGLADGILVCNEKLTFLEFKVRHGNIIHVPAFQYQCMKSFIFQNIPYYHIIYHEGQLYFYDGIQIAEAETHNKVSRVSVVVNECVERARVTMDHYKKLAAELARL